MENMKIFPIENLQYKVWHQRRNEVFIFLCAFNENGLTKNSHSVSRVERKKVSGHFRKLIIQ